MLLTIFTIALLTFFTNIFFIYCIEELRIQLTWLDDIVSAVFMLSAATISISFLLLLANAFIC